MRRGLQLRRASFYHGAKIRNSAVFAPRGKLVGECLPQTLLCGLRRLSRRSHAAAERRFLPCENDTTHRTAAG